MRIVLFLFASFFSADVLGQTAVDSAAAVKRVDSLIQVSRAFTGKRDFDKALEVNAAAEKIALEKLGRESAAFGSCCHNRGRVYLIKGDYPQAEPLILEAKAIREKVLGKEHPDYAQSLNNLAGLYMYLRNYEKAEPLFLEAKSIREKALGKEHPGYAASLGNLADLYYYLGNYEKAVPLYLEAKTIQEKAVGKEHPDYVHCLENLASLYMNLGNYEKAEPLFLEAKAIQEKAVGREHPDYAARLNDLARLYSHLGNYEKAELLYLEAKAIREKTLGKEDPDYAQSLNNLAVLYALKGNYEKAEPLFLEAKAIREKALGKEHPDYANCLYNLAGLYLNLGRYEKAEPLYLEAKAIREKTLGKEHPDYAESLNDLAVLYLNLGNSEKAEPLYLEAKVIREKTVGKEHPDYAQSLNNLTSLYESQNRFSASDPLLAEVSDIEQTRLAKSASFLSERELAIYTATFQVNGGLLGGYLLARSRNNMTGSLPALAFDRALFQKGFLLTAAARLNNLSLASLESEEINRRLKGYRRRLATEYAKPIADRKGVPELENLAASAEKELARTVGGYAEAIRQVKWQGVQAALKPGEAAIELVHFRVFKSDSTMYAALVLLPGAEPPKFIPLFEEKQLEALLKTSGARRSDYVNSLYSTAKTGQKTLYELVWQPLEKELRGAKTIYFSPSGLLHRIHLAAIPISETTNLGDRFRFVELGSTRQLVVPSSAAASAGSDEALLWGGIQYDMDSTAIGAENANLKTDLARTRGGLGFEQTDSTSRLASQSAGGSRGGSWAFLPWTEKEINAIAPILTAAGVKPTSRKGFAATEEVFKAIGSGVKKPSPRILHIATHGYFFPDPKTADGGRKAADGSEPTFKMSDHPMIRSGLLLAGSNQAWKTGKPLRPDLEDGVLTAYEISQMDLSNTELVVLSACETGLGDIQGNEGVYGLQRAFKIAGAKYLIMSLWQVPDFQTQELMTVFYQKWLTAKMPLPEAFRAAQQVMREKYEHPYFWAGFVLVE